MEEKILMICPFWRGRRHICVIAGFAAGFVLMYVTLLERARSFDNLTTISADLPDISVLGDIHQQIGFDLSQVICNASVESTIKCRNAEKTGEDLWGSSQKSRNQLVDKICSTFNQHSNFSISHFWDTLKDNTNIIVDPRHRVLYCAIPKVACSSWRTAIAIMTGQLRDPKPDRLSRVHSPYFLQHIGLPSPPHLTLQQLDKALKYFNKFLVVRHPLERLVSAYRDKFRTYNKWTRHFQLKYGRRIVLLYRERATTEALREGHDVTFAEFLTFILDESIPLEERMNPHWDTYQHLCHPCLLRYQHVLKFETLIEDNGVVLDRYFNVQNSTEFFPKRNIKRVPSRDIMLKYYSTVPKKLIRGVYKHYKTDMEMFDYEMPADIWTNS